MRIIDPKKIFKVGIFLITVSLLATSLSTAVFADVRVAKSSDGWRLLVDGKPYFVKGMCYTPIKVGESPDEGTQRDWMVVDDDHDGRIDAAYQSWVDTNRNNQQDKNEPEVGDFQLLKDMGCNTIRVYHHASADPALQNLYKDQTAAPLLFNHAPNKELLQDLFSRYGIRVAMGDLLGAYGVGSMAPWDPGTDYTNDLQKKNMLMSVEKMVLEFKDEPYILMWVLGNENNCEWTHTNARVHPNEFASFVNTVALRIKKLDPNHPVCIANDEVNILRAYVKNAPDIDIFGTNTYRLPGFGTLWKQISSVYDKPVLLTEYGIPHPKFNNGMLDEEYQTDIHKKAYCDIVAHSAGKGDIGNAIGGFVYEFVDNWWQNGDPWNLNINDKKWNNELTGVAGQENGKASPFLRQLRKVYFLYQKLWKGKAVYP